jgi:D-sedoheptulose 7-phosphate isomerase
MQQVMPDVEHAGKLLLAALKGGKKVLVCGNGGSAADSQHLAAELSGRYKTERKALPGIALTTDTSALTAIGNDYGFENIFKRQVAAIGAKGDLLIAFSTSGSSPNILAAIDEARARKMKVIALTGSKGVSLRKKVDALICVPAEETARIQEVHELVYHAWCEYIDAHISTV